MDLMNPSRRNFLSGAAVVGAAALLPVRSSGAASPSREAGTHVESSVPCRSDVSFVDSVEVRRCGRGVILPMSTGVHVARLAGAEVATSNPGGMIEVVDLFVKDASSWLISGVVVDEMLRARCLCGASELSKDLLRGCYPMLDRISSCGKISLQIAYIGEHASRPFEGCVIGRLPVDRDDSLYVARSGRVETVPVWTDVDVPINSSGLITETLQHPMLVESITVQEPEDWIVNDLLIDGASQFLTAGDVPAEALGAVGLLGLNLGIAREKIEWLVTYMGDRPAKFRCAIVGARVPG